MRYTIARIEIEDESYPATLGENSVICQEMTLKLDSAGNLILGMKLQQCDLQPSTRTEASNSEWLSTEQIDNIVTMQFTRDLRNDPRVEQLIHQAKMPTLILDFIRKKGFASSLIEALKNEFNIR